MIEIILFIIGIVGLIGGNLTISRNSPIKGSRARIAGFILALPVPLSFGIVAIVSNLAFTQAIPPLMEVPLLRWLDLIPAALGVLGAFLYLYSTSPNKKPDTLQFWFIAITPAIGLYVARNLTLLFQTLFDISMRLPLPLILKLELPNIFIGIFIPVAIAFVANLIVPIVTSGLSAILFAIPVFIIHLYYFVISDWILPGISSIAYPGDTPGAGYQEILNGIGYVMVSLLLLMIIAFIGWIASGIRKTSFA